MSTHATCPGCRLQLDTISAQGRADDLYVCSHCYHSWFAFELDATSTTNDDGGHDNDGDAVTLT